MHQHDKVASVSLKEKSWHLRNASKCLVWASICGKVHCSALYWKRKSCKGIKGTGVLCCVKSGIKDRNEKIRSCVQDGIGERKSRLKRTCRDSRERKHQHLA